MHEARRRESTRAYNSCMSVSSSFARTKPTGYCWFGEFDAEQMFELNADICVTEAPRAAAASDIHAVE